MIEPDVTRFEVPTEWLEQARQAYEAYRAVLAEPHSFTSERDADSARRKRMLAAAERRVASAFDQLADGCVPWQPLFLALHAQARRFEQDAADSDAWADWFAEHAARLAAVWGEAV